MRISTEWEFQGEPVYCFMHMGFVSESAGIAWLANEHCWESFRGDMADRLLPFTANQIKRFLMQRFYKPVRAGTIGFTEWSRFNRVRITSIFSKVEEYPEEDQMIVLGIMLALMGEKGETVDFGLVHSWREHLPRAFQLLVMGLPEDAVSAALENDIDLSLMSSALRG